MTGDMFARMKSVSDGMILSGTGEAKLQCSGGPNDPIVTVKFKTAFAKPPAVFVNLNGIHNCQPSGLPCKAIFVDNVGAKFPGQTAIAIDDNTFVFAATSGGWTKMVAVNKAGTQIATRYMSPGSVTAAKWAAAHVTTPGYYSVSNVEFCGPKANFRADIQVVEVTTTFVKIKASTWADSKIYSFWFSWMAIGPELTADVANLVARRTQSGDDKRGRIVLV
jgi:hypothetical protein